jgi:5-methylcytosine-specific restriction protein A
VPWPTGPTRTSTPQHRAWATQVKRNAGGRCQIRLPGCEYDLANGQGACTHCHNIKTREETQRGRARSYGRGKHPRETHPGMVQ